MHLRPVCQVQLNRGISLKLTCTGKEPEMGGKEQMGKKFHLDSVWQWKLDLLEVQRRQKIMIIRKWLNRKFDPEV